MKTKNRPLDVAMQSYVFPDESSVLYIVEQKPDFDKPIKSTFISVK